MQREHGVLGGSMVVCGFSTKDSVERGLGLHGVAGNPWGPSGDPWGVSGRLQGIFGVLRVSGGSMGSLDFSGGVSGGLWGFWGPPRTWTRCTMRGSGDAST